MIPIMHRTRRSPILVRPGRPVIEAVSVGTEEGRSWAAIVQVPAETRELRTVPADRSGDWLTALRADPRQAIQEGAIRCLICGRAMRQLTNTHLHAHHVSAAEYKARFGYNRGRPLMCLALQRLYAERAVKAGLAARIRSRPILVRPELRRRGGARAIALEEWLTRRDARLHVARRNGNNS